MEINSINPYIYNPEKGEKPEAKPDKKPTNQRDQFLKSNLPEKMMTYTGYTDKVDKGTIQELQKESERAYRYLRDLVNQLLQTQGSTFRESKKPIINEDPYINTAKSLIAPGGELSPEKISDRLIGAAKALAAGDPGKIETLRGAIQKGFNQAATALGGKLPAISQETYQLTMEKLDNWAQE